MKLIINIDDNVFTRLFDNGVDTSSDDREVIDRAVRNGKPYEERPHGEWINQLQGAKYPCECSECHKEPFCDDDGYVLSDFCPSCGADMRCKEKQE